MTVDGPTGPLGPADAPATPPLDTCLRTIVEDYVLGDLDAMTTEITWKPVGAVCYPMVMAVLAGSELLGRLAGAPRGKAGGRDRCGRRGYWQPDAPNRCRHRQGISTRIA